MRKIRTLLQKKLALIFIIFHLTVYSQGNMESYLYNTAGNNFEIPNGNPKSVKVKTFSPEVKLGHESSEKKCLNDFYLLKFNSKNQVISYNNGSSFVSNIYNKKGVKVREVGLINGLTDDYTLLFSHKTSKNDSSTYVSIKNLTEYYQYPKDYYCTKYKKDKKGCLIYKTTYRTGGPLIGDESVLDLKLNFNSKGNIIKLETYIEFDDLEVRSEYQYDKFNNLIQINDYELNQDSWKVEFTSKTTYSNIIYDKNHNWIKKDVYINGKFNSVKTRKIVY